MQKLTVEILLPERTLELEPYQYKPPKYSIGQEVYWRSDIQPSQWEKYTVAGIVLKQFLNSDGTINALCAQPYWEYRLAETSLGWRIQPRDYGQGHPTDNDLLTEEEYQTVCRVQQIVDDVYAEFPDKSEEFCMAIAQSRVDSQNLPISVYDI